MKKPPVKLDNYEQVYNFYRDFTPSDRATKIGFRAMSLIAKPNISYDPGAEEAAKQLINSAAKVIVAPNHVNDKDQYVVSALAKSQDSLRSLVGKTFAPAKESLFQSKALRAGVEIMGAIPVFRAIDIKTNDPYQLELQRSATDKFIDTALYRIMERDDNMAIFPEGTRNKVNSTEVQPLKSGIGIIVGKLSTETTVGIIPVGLQYPEDESWRKPFIHVGNPMIIEDYYSQAQVIQELQPRMQNAVDEARDRLYLSA